MDGGCLSSRLCDTGFFLGVSPRAGRGGAYANRSAYPPDHRGLGDSARELYRLSGTTYALRLMACLPGRARRRATDSSVWRPFLRQYHFSLSTTLSRGSFLAKRRQFSSRISSHFW